MGRSTLPMTLVHMAGEGMEISSWQKTLHSTAVPSGLGLPPGSGAVSVPLWAASQGLPGLKTKQEPPQPGGPTLSRGPAEATPARAAPVSPHTPIPPRLQLPPAPLLPPHPASWGGWQGTSVRPCVPPHSSARAPPQSAAIVPAPPAPPHSPAAPSPRPGSASPPGTPRPPAAWRRRPTTLRWPPGSTCWPGRQRQGGKRHREPQEPAAPPCRGGRGTTSPEMPCGFPPSGPGAGGRWEAATAPSLAREGGACVGKQVENPV